MSFISLLLACYFGLLNVSEQETIAATKIEPASPVVKPVELVPAKVSKTPGCILCEFVLNTVVSDLQNVTIEAAVKQVSKQAILFHEFEFIFFSHLVSGS